MESAFKSGFGELWWSVATRCRAVTMTSIPTPTRLCDLTRKWWKNKLLSMNASALAQYLSFILNVFCHAFLPFPKVIYVNLSSLCLHASSNSFCKIRYFVVKWSARRDHFVECFAQPECSNVLNEFCYHFCACQNRFSSVQATLESRAHWTIWTIDWHT